MPLVPTVCARDCPDTCFLDVEIEDGRVLRVLGSRDLAYTAGFTCARGRSDPEHLKSSTRILDPLLRAAGGALRRSTWDEALDTVTDRLRWTLWRHGPESVLLLDYSGNCGLLSSVFPRRLWHALGATQTDQALCTASGHAALALHYGASWGLEPEDLPRMPAIVFWGCNPVISSPHVWQIARKAREAGSAIVAVDVCQSETAEQADRHIAPCPGSDVALAWGVAWHLIQEDAVDDAFVARITVGWEDYRDEALRWPPKRVQSISGLTEIEVRDFARLLALRRPAAFVIGIGMQKSRQGAESVRAVSLLPALLGQERGFLYTNSRGHQVDWDRLSGRSLAARQSLVTSQVSLGRKLEEGAFKFVFIYGMNPVATAADTGAFRRGLARPDVYLAVHDTHSSETTAQADAVLPAASFLEKDDVVLSDVHPWVRMARRVVPPAGQAWDEVTLQAALARRLGLVEPWLHEDPWTALASATRDTFEDGSLGDLRGGATLRIRRPKTGVWPTPSGKIELCASAPPTGVEPLPTQLPVPADDGAFTLLASAWPTVTNSQFRDVSGDPPPTVEMHPDDAARLGLAPGQDVVISNDGGRFTASCKPSLRVPRGVLRTARPLRDVHGSTLNDLVPGDAQRLGGGSTFNSARVRLERV
jgi:anaerobic selenocysteine-containing dehydrogenase